MAVHDGGSYQTGSGMDVLGCGRYQTESGRAVYRGDGYLFLCWVAVLGVVGTKQ